MASDNSLIRDIAAQLPDTAGNLRLAGEILALASQFSDCAYEKIVRKAVGVVLRDCRNQALWNIDVLRAIEYGYRTVDDLRRHLRTDRRRITATVAELQIRALIDERKIPAAGSKGGRPTASYKLTEVGSWFMLHQLKRFREMGFVHDEK